MTNLSHLRTYTYNRQKEIASTYDLLKKGRIDKKFYIKFIGIIRDETQEVIRFMKYYIDTDEDECDRLSKNIADTYYIYLDKVI